MDQERVVLIISEHPEEGWGGPVHYISILIPVLHRMGFQIWLLADGGVSERLGGVLKANNVHVLPRHGGVLFVRKFLSKLPRILRYPIESVVLASWLKSGTAKPERVIVSLCSPGRYLWPSGLLGRGMFVFHSEPSGPRHALAGTIFRFLAGKKATFIGVSEWVTKSLRDVWRIRENRIRLVTMINPSTSAVAPVPYVPEERKVILMVGAANEYKNPWFWLEVAQYVVEHGQPDSIRFRWVGEGPLLNDMRKWVRDRGLTGAIEFPGYSEDLTKHYDEAVVYFQCSVKETSSFSTIDAVNFGLPLLLSTNGGLGEILKDKENGLSVDLSSVRSTSTKLISLLSDPGLLIAFSAHTQKFGKHKYSLPDWERRISELLIP